MKRATNLVEQIASYDNLRLAFYKASKTKQAKLEVVKFRENLDHNLKLLSQQILSGNVSVGKYHTFKIFDPKERMICAAAFDERVLHHAIMNVCHPYFERHLIYDTYATRIGKGTYAALARALFFCTKFDFVAKLDVRKYFDSISHEVLKNKLKRLFKDKTLLLIFDKIIDSYETVSNCGLPIGNLTSQYFANYYLSETDHSMKEISRVGGYVRYMDDILIFENDFSSLKMKVGEMIRRTSEEVALTFKPPIFRKTTRALSFLGYKIRRHCISLNVRSRVRLRKQYDLYQTYLQMNLWSEKQFQNHIIPLFAFAQHAYTKQLRLMLILRTEIEGLEPREPWRQLEQQREELSRFESQQQQPRQPQQQPWLSPGPCPLALNEMDFSVENRFQS